MFLIGIFLISSLSHDDDDDDIRIIHGYVTNAEESVHRRERKETNATRCKRYLVTNKNIFPTLICCLEVV